MKCLLAFAAAVLAATLMFGCNDARSTPTKHDYLKVKIIKVVPDRHWFSSDYTTVYEYENGYRDSGSGVWGNEGEVIVHEVIVGGYEYNRGTNPHFKVK
jgi:hypothetical protein